MGETVLCDQPGVFVPRTMLVFSSQAPETAVRTDRVVVNPPAFDDDLGFFQRVEQLPAEKLIAHLAP